MTQVSNDRPACALMHCRLLMTPALAVYTHLGIECPAVIAKLPSMSVVADVSLGTAPLYFMLTQPAKR